MGDPILLPKFELPGDKTHWAVRLAVISGITLLVAVGGLGAVIMHRHKLEVEAHVAREEAIHAGLLGDWLEANGLPPGSEAVHHRLWEAARDCADLGEHLVVVARFLEARGLDVNAALLPRVAMVDPAAHAVLARIFLKEKLDRTRWMAVAMAMGAIVLLAG